MLCFYTSVKCIFALVISITVIFLLVTEEILSLLETKLYRTLVTIGEVSGKLDILIMNMSKVMRVIIPSEKRILRPERMPALPLNTKEHLKEFEKFLEVVPNLAAAVSIIHLFKY